MCLHFRTYEWVPVGRMKRQNVGKDLDTEGAGFSACCRRTIGEEPFGFYTKTWTKGECRVIAPPHSAITFDVFVRIKQEFCRLFGLSMISSTHISGTYFYQDLMLSYQSFPTVFFFFLSLSLSLFPFQHWLTFSFDILPLITASVKIHSSHHLTYFPKGRPLKAGMYF